jgi:hypothetical protein
MMRAIPTPVAVVVALLAGARPVAAVPPGSATADDAYRLCRAAEDETGEARLALLERGYELARAAVDADPRDARAQFALFCTLGRRIADGGIGLASPFEIFRAFRALDTAMDLAPDDPDLAAAKGALLVTLPRLLGGDAAEGEAWLRRALARDPEHGAARRYLADLLSRRGEPAPDVAGAAVAGTTPGLAD